MSSYVLALPEFFLAIAGMGVLVAGVFRGGNPTRMISWLSVLILAVTLVLVMATQPAAPTTGFGGLFLVDRFAIAGTPADCVAQVERAMAAGARQFLTTGFVPAPRAFMQRWAREVADRVIV